MKWRHWFQNSVEILLTSADIHAALHAISNCGIAAQNVSFVDTIHLRFTVSASSLPALFALIQNRGDEVEVLHRRGITQMWGRVRKRPVLILGLIIIVALSCWLPTRVLFIRVEGNTSIPGKEIIQRAELCGIRLGVSRRAVRSENAKNALLSQMPQLQWVGVNTYGCTAVISVREREDELQQTAPNQTICSIIAQQDAYIRQMTVVSGNPLCRVGQVVKKGQVLVSPYTDCGIYVRLTDAKAEIFGNTQRQIAVIFPTEYAGRTQISSKSKKYSLIIGKKRINFYKGSGISGISCAKIYEEKYVTLPGGFVLPIGIIKEEIIAYDFLPVELTLNESVLATFAQQYLLEQMQAGQILEANYGFSYQATHCRLDSSFHCFEMIGITRPEEGIEQNE